MTKKQQHEADKQLFKLLDSKELKKFVDDFLNDIEGERKNV
ncbi:hypothetical protein [Sporolactobacillus terrae]|nr:hypothetical protein [Sporolactobacillus terrae]